MNSEFPKIKILQMANNHRRHLIVLFLDPTDNVSSIMHDGIDINLP